MKILDLAIILLIFFVKNILADVKSFFGQSDDKKVSIANATILMAFIIKFPGARRPKSLATGNYTFDPKEVLTTPTDIYTDPEQSIAADYFYHSWDYNYADYTTQEDADVTLFAQNLTTLYKNLTNFSDTTQINFIASNDANYIAYSAKLIQNLYIPLNKTSPLLAISNPQIAFTYSGFNASLYNAAKTWPITAQLINDYTANEFGFDISYTCSKFTNWQTYGSTNLYSQNYYTNTWNNTLNLWTEQFNQTGYGPIFYSRDMKPFLLLDYSHLKNNLTAGLIILDTLLVDLRNYPDVSNFTKFVPNGNVSILIDMYKFLMYEYRLFSDFYSNLIINPFFDLLFQEFNLKQQVLLNYTLNITQAQRNRKMIIFTTYAEVFYAFFKMFNYDSSIKANSPQSFISQPNTWTNGTVPPNIPDYLPYIDYGYSLHFELVYDGSADFSDATDKMYIAMRTNFNSDYLLVIPLDDFNTYVTSILMNPGFSPTERAAFCS